jgi:hypothetical protein
LVLIHQFRCCDFLRSVEGHVWGREMVKTQLLVWSSAGASSAVTLLHAVRR